MQGIPLPMMGGFGTMGSTLPTAPQSSFIQSALNTQAALLPGGMLSPVGLINFAAMPNPTITMNPPIAPNGLISPAGLVEPNVPLLSSSMMNQVAGVTNASAMVQAAMMMALAELNEDSDEEDDGEQDEAEPNKNIAFDREQLMNAVQLAKERNEAEEQIVAEKTAQTTEEPRLNAEVAMQEEVVPQRRAAHSMQAIGKSKKLIEFAPEEVVVDPPKVSGGPTNLRHLLPMAQSACATNIFVTDAQHTCGTVDIDESKLSVGSMKSSHLTPHEKADLEKPRTTNLLHLLKTQTNEHQASAGNLESRKKHRGASREREGTGGKDERKSSKSKNRRSRSQSHNRSSSCNRGRSSSHSKGRRRKKKSSSRSKSRRKSRSRSRKHTQNRKRSRSRSHRKSKSPNQDGKTLQASQNSSQSSVPSAEVPSVFAVNLSQSVALASKLAAESRKKRVAMQGQNITNSELTGFENMAPVPPPSEENKTYKSLTLQAVQIRSLLGKGGATINDIRRRSGSDIKIHHMPSEPEGIVSIVGNSEVAESIIAQHLAFKGCPMTNRKT